MSEDLRDAVSAQAFSTRSTPEALRLAEEIVGRGGENVLAVIFFGSRKTLARPGAGSAHDFFVITRTYREFYKSLRRSGSLKRPAGLVAALNTVLPPNQISFKVKNLDSSGGSGHAKCAVVSLKAFLRESAPTRHDHFFLGRLFQPTEIVYASDDASREGVRDALVTAHRLTLGWVRPYLPDRFDVDTYCRTLLRVSFAAEVRPEPSVRADGLWQAQERELRRTYAALLREAAAAGALIPRGEGSYSLGKPVSRLERLRLVLYFRWSKVRATLRWGKYVVTFDDWLGFIVGKAERHTGQQIVLSPRERRMPLLFLWPRLFRYLRHKDK